MVFDNANDGIALAPAKFSLDSSDPPRPSVVAFENFGATIPSSTLFPCGEACRPSCSAAGDCTTDKDTGDDRRLRRGVPFPPDGNSNSVDQTIVIATAVPFGVVVLVVGAVVVLLRRGSKKREAATTAKEADSDVDGSYHANAKVSVIDVGVPAPGMLSMIREESCVSRLNEKKAALVGEKHVTMLSQEQVVNIIADDVTPDNQAPAPSRKTKGR